MNINLLFVVFPPCAVEQADLYKVSVIIRCSLYYDALKEGKRYGTVIRNENVIHIYRW